MATGFARKANITTVEDEPVVRALDELAWQESKQFFFNLQGCFTRSQAGTISDAKDVGIHCQRRLTEDNVEDDVSRFTPYSGQCLQGGPFSWQISTVTFHEQYTGPDDVCGLRVVESQGADMGLQPFLSQCQHGLRGIGDGEEAGSRTVDRLVSGLSR